MNAESRISFASLQGLALGAVVATSLLSGCRSSCCRPRLIEISRCGPRSAACHCPPAVNSGPCDAGPGILQGSGRSGISILNNEREHLAVPSAPPAEPRRDGEKSSRRVYVETVPERSASTSAAAARSREPVTDPDLIRQFAVDPNPVPVETPPAEVAPEGLGDDEPLAETLATPPVIAELNGPLTPAVPETDGIVSGIAEGAAEAVTAEEPVLCQPATDAPPSASPLRDPIILRAIAPDSVIIPPPYAGQGQVRRTAPKTGPSTGGPSENRSGIPAQPVGFQPSTSGFPVGQPPILPAQPASRPLSPDQATPILFRPLPFIETDPTIIRATCGNETPALQQLPPAGPAHDPVSNTASIRDGVPAAGSQR